MLDPNSKAARRLRDEVIIWLATVRPNGQPDLVPVWHLLQDDGTILIYSRPNKLKLRNIAKNPRVALSVDNTHGGGNVVRVEGTAEHVANHPPVTAIPAYLAKYGEHITRIGYTAEQFAGAYSEAIVVWPEKVRG